MIPSIKENALINAVLYSDVVIPAITLSMGCEN